MSTTPNMSLVLPTDHASTDVWGAAINTAMGLVDAHDHSPGKGVKISQAGIGITGDLTFASHAATNMSVLDLIPVTTTVASAYSSALFTNSADNNLYWRTNLGTNVQITNGGTLNFSVTGGFGGDYSSAGALADFIDASDEYHFFQQLGGGVRQYARVAHADLDLFEYKANPAGGVPTNRIRIKSPAAVAASFDMTLPGALNGASNTVFAIDTTGLITFPTNVVIGGSFKALDNLHTAAWEVHFPLVGSAAATGFAGITYLKATASANAWIFISGLLPSRVGDIITRVDSAMQGEAAQTYTFTLVRVNFGIETTIESWTDVENASTHTTSHTLSSPYTTVSGDAIYMKIAAPVGHGAADFVYKNVAFMTHPA